MVAPWITVNDLVNPLSRHAEDAVASASFILYNLSGRKYGGVHTTRETYCQTGIQQLGVNAYARPPLPGPSGYPLSYPELAHGAITNRMGGSCGSCGCPHTIRLRGGPVLSVQSVYDGDREIPLCDVAIYDYRYLMAGTRNCWGSCGELEVTYTYGAPPPAMGRVAAKALADQYLLAMEGDEDCALPQRVTSISRQGMSWTLLDPQEFLDKGKTGIYQVDLFLTAVNPDGARLRSRVFSPDTHRGKSYRWADQNHSPAESSGAPASAQMSAPTPTLMSLPTAQAAPASSTQVVTTYTGQHLRWVVPGSFTQESPPTLVVRPSGEEVPPVALSWRSGNFILDLNGTQVERLLPPGSVLVVSSTGTDGSTSGQASYPVERRTL